MCFYLSWSASEDSALVCRSKHFLSLWSLVEEAGMSHVLKWGARQSLALPSSILWFGVSGVIHVDSLTQSFSHFMATENRDTSKGMLLSTLHRGHTDLGSSTSLKPTLNLNFEHVSVDFQMLAQPTGWRFPHPARTLVAPNSLPWFHSFSSATIYPGETDNPELTM